MTTKNLALTQAWVQIAGAEESFFLENKGSGAVLVTLQDIVPDANTPYHVVPRGQSFLRMGTGTAYARASSTALETSITYTN